MPKDVFIGRPPANGRPPGAVWQLAQLPSSERRAPFSTSVASKAAAAGAIGYVAWWSRKLPSMDEVTMTEFCFSTPRIIMQR